MTGGDETAADDEPARRGTRAIPLIPLTLAPALVAACALAGWTYFTQYRPDTETDEAVAQRVVGAARDGAVAVMSYKPDTLNQDFAAAKSRLTGDFLNYYDQFSKQVIAPAAQSGGATATARVVGAAATELHPDSATVLVFVDQLITGRDQPRSMASSGIRVSLSKESGDWLIAKFDPL